MDEDKAETWAKVIVIVSGLTVGAFVGVLVWGIIELVSWVVTK